MIRVNRLATLAVAFCLLIAARQSPAAVNVGDKPVLDFEATDGAKVNAQTLKGKIVVVDFWATWCGPCMAEAEHMVQVNNTYAKQGLQFIGISLDQDRGKLEQVVKDKGFVWPQHFDGQGWGNRFAKEWGVTGIPATFILSPDGVVLWKGHPAQLDAPLANAFKQHPPRLIDTETLAKVKAMLDKAEAAMKADQASAAMLIAAKLPAEARSEKEVGPRVEALLKQLEEYADASLAEAEAALEKEQFVVAITKFRDLAKLTGLAAAKKAAERLRTVMAMPQAKSALAEAEKVEKERERAAKAQDLLEAAKKQQEAKKHEQAFTQFKAIVQQYAGTEAATAAGIEVKKYESDPAFVKRANEAAASGKAKGMLSMAASYKTAGRDDLARQKYQQVITDFPGTTFAEQAKKELAALK